MPPALRQRGCIALGASREPRVCWLGLGNGRPTPRPTRGGALPTRAQVRPPPEGGQGGRRRAPRRGRGLPGSSAGVGCGAVWRQLEGRSEQREKRKVKRPETQLFFSLVFLATEVNPSPWARNSRDQGCAVPGARVACSLCGRLRAGLGAASAELLGRALCGCRCPGLGAPSAPLRVSGQLGAKRRAAGRGTARKVGLWQERIGRQLGSTLLPFCFSAWLC